MSDNTPSSKKQISPDWLVQGILTKIGDTFDRLTGRGWKPSSSLATSELIERLKRLVDSESRESADKRRFVPHNIKLKMQWDKFSTDSDDSLKKLETELLTALVDHINDKRYYTYARISLEVKADYFTSGVKLFAGFEKSEDSDRETEITMSIPGDVLAVPTIEEPQAPDPVRNIRARFQVSGQDVRRSITYETGKRLSIGRTKENDLAIDDASVSKMHASLMLNPEGSFVLADTGSTNGTFIDGERISYGKAITFSAGQKIRLGNVEVAFEILEIQQNTVAAIESPVTDPLGYRIGEFEFTAKIEPSEVGGKPDPAETVPSIEMPKEVLPEHESRIEILEPLATGPDAEPTASDPMVQR